MKKIWETISMYFMVMLLFLVLVLPFLTLLYLGMHVIDIDWLFPPLAVIIYIVVLVRYSGLFGKDRPRR